MTGRIGLGPVFAYEWSIASRRRQLYAMRSLFVLALLVGTAVVWGREDGGAVTGTAAAARVTVKVFYAVAGTQLALVLLAAPAAAAGAVCVDRARGTLADVLTTDLSDAEIVLGKLAARLVPVLGLIAVSAPVMFLCALMGGLDPDDLFRSYVVASGVAVLGCSLALTLSVVMRKTHEVLLATYALWSVWLLFGLAAEWLSPAPPRWAASTNPFYLSLDLGRSAGSAGWGDGTTFLAATLLISALLLAFAVWRLRRVEFYQTPRRSGLLSRAVAFPRRLVRRFPRLPGPSLDGNPVLWREWHRVRPSWTGRLLWGAYFTAALAFSILAILVRSGPPQPLGFIAGFQAAIGLLLLSVSASTALADERARGSLDVLMATPLSTRTIVWGKWWGSFRTVLPLAVLPAVVVGVTDQTSGARVATALVMAAIIVIDGAAVTSLGLAMATWVPRPGRAVGWTVAVYVLVTVGYFLLLVALLNSGPSDPGRGLACASPFYGAFLLTMAAHESRFVSWPYCLGWLGFWGLAWAAAAAGLIGATLATSERCLGRMPESGSPPAVIPPRPSAGRRGQAALLLEDMAG